MKRTIPLVPTIFTAFSLLVLLALGSWQLYRLNWKNNLIAEITERVAMTPIELPKGNLDVESLKYRRALLKGHFLHDKEIHLFTGPIRMKGELGYNILTPLELQDGKVVLVNRGWVPSDKKEQSSRPETLIKGEIQLVVMLQEGEKQGTFIPDNDTGRNLWFWIDMPAIASFTGKDFDNVYFRAIDDGKPSDILPVPGKSKIEIRNDHLKYAIIWFSFVIILSVIYTIYIKRNQIPSRGNETK